MCSDRQQKNAGPSLDDLLTRGLPVRSSFAQLSHPRDGEIERRHAGGGGSACPCPMASDTRNWTSRSTLPTQDNLRLAGKLGCNNAADLPPPVPERLEHLRATARNLFVVSSTHDRLQPSLSALRTYQVRLHACGKDYVCWAQFLEFPRLVWTRPCLLAVPQVVGTSGLPAPYTGIATYV